MDLTNVMDIKVFPLKVGETAEDLYCVETAKNRNEVKQAIMEGLEGYCSKEEIQTICSDELVNEVNKYRIVNNAKTSAPDTKVTIDNLGPKVALLGTGYDGVLHIHLTDTIIIEDKVYIEQSMFESFTDYAN